MPVRNINSIGYLLIFLVALLSGCGGSGGQETSDTPSSSADVVNGYYVVKSTTVNEFDEVVGTIDYDVDFESRNTTVTYTDYDLIAGTSTNSFASYFFNENGQMLRWRSSDGGNTLYKINEQGLLSEIIESSSIYGDSVFSYDASGKLLTRVRTYGADGIVTQRSTQTYVYNDSGALSSSRKESVFFQEEPFNTYTTFENKAYILDSEGRIIRRESIDESSDGSIMTSDDYEYDANGNMVKTTYTYDGLWSDTRTYEYAVSEKPLYNRWLRIFRFFP